MICTVPVVEGCRTTFVPTMDVAVLVPPTRTFVPVSSASPDWSKLSDAIKLLFESKAPRLIVLVADSATTDAEADTDVPASVMLPPLLVSAKVPDVVTPSDAAVAVAAPEAVMSTVAPERPRAVVAATPSAALEEREREPVEEAMLTDVPEAVKAAAEERDRVPAEEERATVEPLAESGPAELTLNVFPGDEDARVMAPLLTERAEPAVSAMVPLAVSAAVAASAVNVVAALRASVAADVTETAVELLKSRSIAPRSEMVPCVGAKADGSPDTSTRLLDDAIEMRPRLS